MESEKFLAIPVIVFSFLSFLSCVYVCYESYKKYNNIRNDVIRHQTNNKHTTYGFSDIIFFMAFTDGLHDIELFLNWLPQGISFIHPWSNKFCNILGIFGQFLGVQSPLWHMILAYNLIYLLYGETGSLDELAKQKIYQYTLVFIIPTITTIIPGIFKQYGKYQNNTDYSDYECWLISDSWQLIWTVTNILALLIHLVSLLYALCKWKNAKEKHESQVFSLFYRKVCVNILRFVLVYTLIRIMPITSRIVEILQPNNYTLPLWAIITHHVFISLNGVGNLLVWIWNQNEGKCCNDNNNDDTSYYLSMITTTTTFTTNLQDK